MSFLCGELCEAGTHRRAPTSPQPFHSYHFKLRPFLLSCAGMHYLPSCMPPCVRILVSAVEYMGLLLNRGTDYVIAFIFKSIVLRMSSECSVIFNIGSTIMRSQTACGLPCLQFLISQVPKIDNTNLCLKSVNA